MLPTPTLHRLWDYLFVTGPPAMMQAGPPRHRHQTTARLIARLTARCRVTATPPPSRRHVPATPPPRTCLTVAHRHVTPRARPRHPPQAALACLHLVADAATGATDIGGVLTAVKDVLAVARGDALLQTALYRIGDISPGQLLAWRRYCRQLVREDCYMAVAWPLHGRYMAVTWPSHGRHMAVTWPLLPPAGAREETKRVHDS